MFMFWVLGFGLGFFNRLFCAELVVTLFVFDSLVITLLVVGDTFPSVFCRFDSVFDAVIVVSVFAFIFSRIAVVLLSI